MNTAISSLFVLRRRTLAAGVSYGTQQTTASPTAPSRQLRPLREAVATMSSASTPRRSPDASGNEDKGQTLAQPQERAR
jgi:hypothetical protein